ncbi:MAG: monofunctional biosynthetic peptidoglycan transglycosylase [Bacteroidota bacterium]
MQEEPEDSISALEPKTFPSENNSPLPVIDKNMPTNVMLGNEVSDRYKQIARQVWRISAKVMLGLVCLSVFFVVVFKFVPPLFTPLMASRSLEAIFSGKDSHIYYEWTPYEDISPEAALAVVASEDQAFPTHWGFDLGEIKKAVKQNKVRKRKRGASTITQQVAKNMFLWNGRSYFRKGLEAYFTILLEVIWGKERILEVYLNIAETGDRTFGVQAASKRFFGVPAHKISRRQAATLAAVLPNPRRFSARNPSGYIQGRTNFIVRQIRQLGGTAYLKDLRSF